MTSSSSNTERPIDSIKIGKRHRRELRNLDFLPPASSATVAFCTPSSSNRTASLLLASGGCAPVRRSAGKRFRCACST